MTDRELSEEAGLDQDVYTWNQIQLERFAELIRADERDKCAQDYLQDCSDAVEAARLKEREECAKLCEGKTMLYGSMANKCAAAIRQRESNHETT